MKKLNLSLCERLLGCLTMRIFTLLTILATFLQTGCYQVIGTRVVRLDDVSIGPKGEVVVLAVIEYRKRYPLWNFSGWGPGVPKISGRKARILTYNLNSKEIKERAAIKFPGSWDHSISIRLHIFDNNGGLYFILKGCPKSNQNCNYKKYYHLYKDGEISEIKSLPTVTKRINQVAVLEYDNANNVFKVKIGTRNKNGTIKTWKYVLLFHANGNFIPLAN